MFIRLSASNSRSLRDETALSFVASADDTLPNNVLTPDAIAPNRLVKTAVIYGGNASGKSTVLKSFDALANMVRYSHADLKPSAEIPITPFLLDSDYVQKPSRFEAEFIKDGVRTWFGFIADRKQVLEEWIYIYPLRRQQRLYHRTGSEYQFGSALRGENRSISRLVRPNSLFISAAAQNNHQQLQEYSSWISRNLRFHNGSSSVDDEIEKRLGADADFRGRVLNLLRAADTGICDIDTEDKPFAEGFPGDLTRAFAPEFIEKMKEQVITNVMFTHQSDKGRCERKFGLSSESKGTQKLIALASMVFDTLDNGGVLMVDELDTSLHPLITRTLLGLFSSDSNKGGGQLLFSTHDIGILDQSLFRRDQVWFTEKDRTGATTLYPLSDYKPRKGENLAKGYIYGRYGGVPFATEPLV